MFKHTLCNYVVCNTFQISYYVVQLNQIPLIIYFKQAYILKGNNNQRKQEVRKQSHLGRTTHLINFHFIHVDQYFVNCPLMRTFVKVETSWE